MSNELQALIPGLRRRDRDLGPAAQLIQPIRNLTADRDVTAGGAAKFMISTEGLNDSDRSVLSDTLDNLSANMQAHVSEIFADHPNVKISKEGIMAGTAAALLGANPQAFIETKLSVPQIEGKWAGYLDVGTGDGTMHRQVSFEAYDERSNRNASMTSVVYNLLAIRQDAFGEAFFKTIVVNPTEVGVALEAKLITAVNDFQRSASGALANFNRQNVIRAYANAEILRNELTRAIPVRRTSGADQNDSLFVPDSVFTPWTETIDGLTIPTSFLRTGVDVDLIGLSATDELLALGILDITDTLDTYNVLNQLCIQFTDGTDTDVAQIDASIFPGSTFTYAPQGNYRRMLLDLDTDSCVLTSDTPLEGGGAAAYLTELATHNVRVRLKVSGSINIAEGKASVQGGGLELVSMQNASTGELVTGAAFDTLAAKIASASILGYTTTSYRANSNIRQRGQLIETIREYQLVNIPYRSPITTLMPATDQGDNDSSAVQTLISSTNIRNSNSAVTALLRARSILDGYSAVPDNAGALPEFFGMGRYYVNPYFAAESVDLSLVVDSRTSHERVKDIRGALVEKIRYYAAEMYRQSQYKAAVNVLYGQPDARPTIIVGTDQVIHQYLMADGDFRTLGEEFNVQIVSTMDTRMAGKIIMSFGNNNAEAGNQVDPLHFGNFLWSPEVTVVMPISRQGQVSKELIVTPRFLHLVNLPVMVELTVTNLPAVTNKVNVNTFAVT